MKSTHICEVVPITLEKHEGADTLSVIRVFGGYTYIAKTESWQGVTKACYIPPDSLLDTRRPEFSFLATEKPLYEVDGNKVYYRIKAKKIRGIVSFGFMVPVPDETPLGEDWAGRLGVIHFDEDVHSSSKQKNANLSGGESTTPPNCYFIKYDVDSLRRYKNVFKEGEMVWCSEKRHGQNQRIVFSDNELHVGSRGEWKREYASPPNYEAIEKNLREKLTGNVTEEEIVGKLVEIKKKIENWNPSQNHLWKAVRQIPGIEEFCKAYPNYVLYGECLGVQQLRYGLKPGEVAFEAFDIMKPNGEFLDVLDFFEIVQRYEIPSVPTLDIIPFNFEKVCELAEGKAVEADHVREGCVCKSMKEEIVPRIGRKCFKVVGAGYLEKA